MGSTPGLVLGPILRSVEEDRATVWVEADAACEVTVRADGLEGSSETFAIEGHHYALVDLQGLEPGASHVYEVLLDGEGVWPERESELPPSTIRPISSDGEVSIAFGSCRISLPHHPPYVLGQEEHPDGHGIDALRAFALRAAAGETEPLPSCLLMLGDQIYADELSPAMQEITEGRARPDRGAGGQLMDFDEYAAAYHEAWSEPAIRWLLSTVPTAMIFDDHEIRAEWKISRAWMEMMREETRYERQVPDGLMAYWVYQHIGNLTPDVLGREGLLQRVREEPDAGQLLRSEMTTADDQAGHSRWSYSRDLGRTRLIVIDSRAGRELDPGRRKLVADEEWEWVVESCHGDFDHLLLASSVPFFLTPGLHYIEAWNEAVTDGAWGNAATAIGERIRREAVMDHWASFQRSFHAVEDLLESVVKGRYGTPPQSVVMLSGDVHHCYLAEIGFPSGTGSKTRVWQAVCSGLRKQLKPKERWAMAAGNSRAGELVARALADAANVDRPRLGWRIVSDPAYDNQIATLQAGTDWARIVIETTTGADWEQPTLRPAFRADIA